MKLLIRAKNSQTTLLHGHIFTTNPQKRIIPADFDQRKYPSP